jgi:DNA-binding IclR family transcriptional regulator
VKQAEHKASERGYPIQALRRGLSVLDAMMEAREPLNLEQVCARTGLPKATAFRIVLNLLDRGYLIETPEGYWLGLKLMRLGAAVEERLDLKEQALPFLQNLLEEFNETTQLAVLDSEDGLRGVCLEKLTPQRAVGIMMSRVGNTFPIHCTGLGKVLAAFRPEEEILEQVRTYGLHKYTATTLAQEDAFMEELRRIRSRGYSIDNGEHEESIRCVAAPIQDRNGTVVAAISVSGPSTRMPNPLTDSVMAARVVETARGLSEALGNSGGLTTRLPA